MIFPIFHVALAATPYIDQLSADGLRMSPGVDAMRPNQLLLRCYARKQGRLWSAVCIDLSLAAQADSFEAARDKLDAQIREYLHDALVGEDRGSARMLLSRKAPLEQRLTYHMIGASQKLRAFFHTASKERGERTQFDAPLPLVPVSC